MAHRILVVDGDELVRRSVQDSLEAAGFEVLLATGEDALDLLDRHEFHLVLTERRLPQTDGLSLLSGHPVDAASERH